MKAAALVAAALVAAALLLTTHRASADDDGPAQPAGAIALAFDRSGVGARSLRGGCVGPDGLDVPRERSVLLRAAGDAPLRHDYVDAGTYVTERWRDERLLGRDEIPLRVVAGLPPEGPVVLLPQNVDGGAIRSVILLARRPRALDDAAPAGIVKRRIPGGWRWESSCGLVRVDLDGDAQSTWLVAGLRQLPLRRAVDGEPLPEGDPAETSAVWTVTIGRRAGRLLVVVRRADPEGDVAASQR